MDFGGGDEIRFERIGLAGIVTLTRPAALNAVTHRMIKALAEALQAWRDDPAVAVVVIKGEGRAFSAGGDILAVYEAGRRGAPPVDFFADEYRLNAYISAYPKPYVALIDGIVMGGGVGISFHGSHRVLTENAVFAMPEVGIGFFPDVGGSHLLPDLGECFGLYLGLTGKRVRWGDALWSGPGDPYRGSQPSGGPHRANWRDRRCRSGPARGVSSGSGRNRPRRAAQDRPPFRPSHRWTTWSPASRPRLTRMTSPPRPWPSSRAVRRPAFMSPSARSRRG